MRKWFWTIGSIALLVGLILMIVLNGGGTGFHDKTLWDWLNLLGGLALPVGVGFGAVWYITKQTKASEAAAEKQREAEREKVERQRNTELELAERRHKTELELAEQQQKIELKLAEQRQKTEREIATDNQREAALQAYLDAMSELLLEKNLRGSSDGHEVRKIAQVRTLTLLRRLDPERKGSVVRFLHEAGLIHISKNIVELRDADLTSANLRDAFLSNAYLFRANLSGADLSGAILLNASLMGANLTGANLNRADLTGARLVEADLDHADLTSARVTDEQLGKAKTLKGAIMPDGKKRS